MKIINLSYSDKFGGAARSAYNIHKSLVINKINSKMFVVKKMSDDIDVITIDNFLYKSLIKFKNYISILISNFYFNGDASFNFFSNYKLVKKINNHNPDIVLIHWVHAEMLSIEDLSRIKAKKIFVLHDMWWLYGCQHYFDEKKKINHIKKNFFNLDASTQNRKKKLKIKNIITPSKWLGICVSSFFKNKMINSRVIKYPVDSEVFKPIKIRENKKIRLLFVGFGRIDQNRKGIDLLIKVLKKINLNNFELTIVGEIDFQKFKNFKFNIKFINFINSDKKLNKIYNNSDILLFTSRQDNLPNVVLESMSSGLPIIAFNIGGLKDLIQDNISGYLCKPFDVKEFSQKLENLILEKGLRKKFSNNAIKFVKKNSDYKHIGKQYSSYFKKILK